jgi:hypothetical protein
VNAASQAAAGNVFLVLLALFWAVQLAAVVRQRPGWLRQVLWCSAAGLVLLLARVVIAGR